MPRAPWGKRIAVVLLIAAAAAGAAWYRDPQLFDRLRDFVAGF